MRIAGLVVVAVVACSSPRERAAPAAVSSEPTPAPPLAPDASATVAPVAVAPAPADARAERIELTFMGDIMAGGTFSGRWVPQQQEEHDPLEALSAQVSADLAIANLETPIVSKIPTEKLDTDLRFGALPTQMTWLAKHGITVVSLANNHANDLEVTGVRETPVHLKALGVTPVGAARTDGGPLVRAETVVVKGWKIGLIAVATRLNRGQRKADPSLPLVDGELLEATVVPVVAAARADHDLVFVMLHWGRQYADAPDRWQVKAAHAFIDAGADGVIAHHPHVWQRVERYKSGLIAYSLGNFVFQNSVAWQRLTGVLRLGFQRATRCLDLVAIHPAAMHSQPVHHPEPVTGKLLKDIVERLTRLSGEGPNPTKLAVEGDRLVGPGACN
ncbi:MAG: CapA family protein [Kofleriaceae bacterium]